MSRMCVCWDEYVLSMRNGLKPKIKHGFSVLEWGPMKPKIIFQPKKKNKKILNIYKKKLILCFVALNMVLKFIQKNCAIAYFQIKLNWNDWERINGKETDKKWEILSFRGGNSMK